ncbi:hypothetical protein O181_101058 [Austropuccinia psidii MF-1]|uniref:Uncharacterized protein n=1 Tax=Austropuccinia psidii MF-1 TaxID=1389203 RepID=A0A9Q3JFT8_9BASI|nr:hypothetical protein [Austropuccinia psidii MF-1]
MSLATVSQASSPSEAAATTQESVRKAPTNPKCSWVRLYFTDLTNGSVECQLTQARSLQVVAHLINIFEMSDPSRQSPQQQEKVITVVKLFYDEIKANTLLTNVCTRWNSTYDIFKCAWSLKEAYNQFCGPTPMQQY